MSEYITQFDLCAVVVSLVTLAFFMMRHDCSEKKHIFFLLFIMSGLIAAVFDYTSLLMRNDPDLFVLEKSDLCVRIFLLSHNLTPLFFALSATYILGLQYRMNAWKWIVMIAPSVVVILVLFVPELKNMIYYYEDGTIYHHGSLFPIFYAVTAVYVIFVSALVIRYRKVISSRDMIMLMLFVILSVVPIIIQIIYPRLKIVLLCQAFAALGGLLTLENDDYRKDSVTGLYGDKLFFGDIRKLLIMGHSARLVVISIPEINDNKKKGSPERVGFLLRALGESLGKRKWQNTNSVVYYVDEGIICILCYNKTDEDMERMGWEIEELFSSPFSLGDKEVRATQETNFYSFPEEIPNEWAIKATIKNAIDKNQ